jgi:hypothetical protein
MAGADSYNTGTNLNWIGLRAFTRNLKSQRAFMEETFNRILLTRRQSVQDRLKTDELFASRCAEAQTNKFLLCGLLMPALTKMAHGEARGLAALRLSRVAIALEQFRLQNGGSYPASLSELSPRFLSTVPGDPFTDGPFSYSRTGRGYILSSVGSNAGKETAKPIPADRDRGFSGEPAKVQQIQVVTPRE